MSTDSEILKELQAQVRSAVQSSSSPTLPIKYVDVIDKKIPPDDKKYLEIVEIKNPPSDRYYSGDQIKAGFLRLILHWPINKNRPYDPRDLIEEIAGHFNKSLNLIHSQITQSPKTTTPIAETDEMLYPATIRFQSF